MMDLKLTEYSHGAGCGCKISPQVLDGILKTNLSLPEFPNLIVGHSSKDDAAVVDLGNGEGIISTTDFFMPIVDDPFDFGRIAATNAISDIYGNQQSSSSIFSRIFLLMIFLFFIELINIQNLFRCKFILSLASPVVVPALRMKLQSED